MVATKHCLLLFFVLVLISFSVQAQQCGNCKEISKIAAFGFDIKVKEPNKDEGTENLWPEWKNLFILAGVVSAQIGNNEKGCLRITTPPSVDTGDVQLISVGGETFVNLPNNPLISSDLSKYGNYFMTGSITNNGTSCQLRVEVYAACNRKVVTSAQTSFSLSSVVGNVSNIARQVTTQLSPLADKIKKFELAEREQSKELSLFSVSGGDPIKITPQKKTLRSGESTSFTIEVKDCDGTPLVGREVLFNETTFEGFKVPGTIGGTVSPSKVVTDANGMAKATFTLKGASQEAIISAHSPGKDVKGCNSILFGDAAINIKYTYSGYVTYTYEGISSLTSDTSDNTMNHFFTGRDVTGILYRASFYGDGGDGSEIGLTSTDDEGGGNEVPDMLESGTYHYFKSDYWKNTLICNCVGKGDVTEQKIRANSDGEIKKSTIAFSYNDGGGRLSLNMVFTTENSGSYKATYLPSQTSSSKEEFNWSVDFDTFIDKNFKIKKEKVGNRIRYTAEGEQSLDVKNLHQSGKIKIVVWEE